MSKFEIACVTMHQKDFSKIREMNIHSDVIFANQCDRTAYEEVEFDEHTARMISTETRGVGVNRNLVLTYAKGDIILFADDDVTYIDDLEEIVTAEFDSHPDADVFIFHLDTDDPKRKQKKYPKTRKCSRFERMPWGGVRIAVRLNSIRKANIWFTTLFGGGCIFPSGEDSIWLLDAKRKGLTFYVSDKTIGIVSFENSSWYTGADERFYYGKGAFYQAVHPKTKYIWMIYFAFRTSKSGTIKFADKIRWMKNGTNGYNKLFPLNEWYKS
ncbi:MAG: glycosyltransferase family A protein [Candidatus Ornithospirochaeta sp.]